MTTEHFAAFGMIVHFTASIDGLFEKMIVAMTATTDNPAFYPILSFLSAKDKQDYILAISKVSNLSDPAKNSLVALLDRAKSAFSFRNDVAHCLWMQGRRKGTIKPLKLTARGTMRVLGSNHNEKEWTIAELMAEVEKIRMVGLDLALFMTQNGLFPASPKRSWETENQAHYPKTDKPNPGR